MTTNGSGARRALGSQHREIPHLDPLVKKAKEGDTSAFGTLFQLNSRWVYAKLLRILGPGPDLDDLVQEVFIRAYRSLRTFRGQARFESWLRRICERVAYDTMKSNRRSPQLSLVETEPELEDQSNPNVERREAARHLMRIIRTLPPANGIVLILHDVEGHTLEEIKKVVGARTVGTIKSRLRLARAELHRRAQRTEALKWVYEERAEEEQ